jgi:hypothetical protein
MTLVTEDLGVVDFVREATLADGRAAGLGWILLAVGSVAGAGFLALRRRRLLMH